MALLVLAHQTQMHNLITLTNYQTRLTLHALGKDEGTPAYAQATLASLPEDAREKITKPSEQLLRYLLFSGEASLGGQDGAKLLASSAFARGFAAQGCAIPISARCATSTCRRAPSATPAAISSIPAPSTPSPSPPRATSITACSRC